MSLNRKHLSFLITFFSLSIVVLVLFNIHLGKVGSEEDEYIVEMMLAEEDIEELLKEKELLEQMQEVDPIKSHMAMNETVKPSIGEPEPLKTLEELRQEAALNENHEPSDLVSDGAYASKVKELAKKREEKKQLLGEKEAKKEAFTNALANKRTSISYSLVERHHYDLPPPIYTCLEGGKVVINIVVDSNGNVTDANLNQKSSSTSDWCLVENAIAYALKAKFNSSSTAAQKGTITYLFQQKAR
jgi:TonB family protein